MTTDTTIFAPVSAGELIDKITILRIKSARLTDPPKLQHVNTELAMLDKIARDSIRQTPATEKLTADLQSTNELLWDVEDELRLCEHARDFGDHFIELARSVYRHNDRRCAIKREINVSLSSPLIEEKSYRG